MRASLESFKDRFKTYGQRLSLLEIKQIYSLKTDTIAELLNVQSGHARHWQSGSREMSDSQIELLYFKLRDLSANQEDEY